MNDVIVTDNLTKRYRGKTVLDRLNLRVPGGAIFAFLGDNGAGKTTTIKILTGQIAPDAGRASILDLDCWSKTLLLRRRVGYVPERPRFYDWMTVDEIGWFTAAFHESGFQSNYQDWAVRLQLDLSKRLRDLSKGGYARVGLALALASDPSVLILDEPTSGLDLLTRRDFLSSMVELAGTGRTVLISSHQIAEVERIASHVGFLSNGVLLIEGPIEEVKQRFVRISGEGSIPNIGGKILHREGGKRIWSVLVQDPNMKAINGLDAEGVGLEEIYAALMRPLA